MIAGRICRKKLQGGWEVRLRWQAALPLSQRMPHARFFCQATREPEPRGSRLKPPHQAATAAAGVGAVATSKGGETPLRVEAGSVPEEGGFGPEGGTGAVPQGRGEARMAQWI